jgi:hypothetical protein
MTSLWSSLFSATWPLICTLQSVNLVALFRQVCTLELSSSGQPTARWCGSCRSCWLSACLCRLARQPSKVNVFRSTTTYTIVIMQAPKKKLPPAPAGVKKVRVRCSSSCTQEKIVLRNHRKTRHTFLKVLLCWILLTLEMMHHVDRQLLCGREAVSS